MKYSIAAVLIFAALSLFAQEKPFSIAGKVAGKTDGMIYLTYARNNDVYISDSTPLKNGHFVFNGMLSGPAEAHVRMEKDRKDYLNMARLFIVPANMKLLLVYDNFRDAVLSGSGVQEEQYKLDKSKVAVLKKKKPFDEVYTKALEAYRAAITAKKDTATIASLKAAVDDAKEAMGPYQTQLAEIDKAFMNQYPASYVTASMMRFSMLSMSISEAERRYNKLTPATRNSSLGIELSKQLEELRMGSPGVMAYVFTATDINGDKLSLADFRGKYVLVDFWASWCVPCRKGNPHLLALYSKYKDKGFEIIGVSDDDKKPAAWRKAVTDDKIDVWKHVLRGMKPVPDGGYDKSESINEHYGISTLPTKILIDKEGKIIGRYSSEEGELDEILKKIFGI